ncbi:hypothetical protein [Telmatospirillum sp.]|uniref:SH3 domain-containing protein n=1 Tax=Telmatospirillum sp. TaxID=2079197 RepID=UPI002845C6E4|nr:hypothetical protein [Telmatospirillum sp.]MDR3436203.1 hypothetical protein [Telmatospirillum sp.]
MKPTIETYRLGLALPMCLVSSAAFAAEGVAIGSGTLRAGPWEEYPSIASVSTGQILDVLGCLNRHGWCDVSAEGERGWLTGSRIAFVRGTEHFVLVEHYDEFKPPVVVCSLNEYWGSHYESRPWFSDDKWRHGKDALPADWKRKPSQDAVPKEPVAAQPKPQAGTPAVAAPSKQETKTPAETPAVLHDNKPVEKTAEPVNKPAARLRRLRTRLANPKMPRRRSSPAKRRAHADQRVSHSVFGPATATTGIQRYRFLSFACSRRE